MATNKLEIVLNRIKTGIGKCSNRADVETLVNEATEYSLNSKQVQTIVDALCDKYNVGEFQGTDEKLEKLVEYLESLEGISLRKINDGTDITLLAEAIYANYKSYGTFSMAKTKAIAVRCGYVFGPNFKSTVKMFNLLK